MILNFDVKDFLNYLIVEKGHSRNTLDAYRRDLFRFEQYLLSIAVKDIANIDYACLFGFLKIMYEEELSPATKRRNLACLKTFFRFCKREGYVKHNFAQYVESPKLWQELPEILTQQEMSLFLDTPHQKGSSVCMRLRNRAICELLYGSGLRISELINAKVGDLGEDTIKVMGKGSIQRIVPITKHSKFAIETYWSQKRKEDNLKLGDFIFTSFRGKKIDRFETFRMIQRHAELCGIQKKISPHSFRHTFATHLLNNGADLAVLKDLLGHASVATTGKYLHLSTEKLSKNFIKHHPRYTQMDSLGVPLYA